MELYSFEKLEVYKQARKLVVDVYRIADAFPDFEKFCLCSQIRRAISSVTSNVAESCGRKSFKDNVRFIEIAYGSLLESFCQLQTAVDLDYITPEDIEKIRPRYFDVSRLLNGLSQSYQQKLNS